MDGKTWIKAGAQLLTEAEAKPPVHTLGHVTSIAFSPELDTPIALALLSDGAERRDQIVYAHFPLHNEVVAARVTSAHFIDPDGERMRG